MSSILVPLLYGLAGITAYAAVQHALVARRRPHERTHVLFALLCAVIAAYVLAKAGAYQADTAEALVERRRWELSLAILTFVLLPWFAREYTAQRSLWPPLALSVSIGVVLMANLLLPYGVGYTSLPEFGRVLLPWGEQVADLRAHQRGAWFHAGRIAMVLVFLYALHASWRQYRRGDRRRALTLARATSVFLMFFIFNQMVNQGIVDFVHTAEFGFLALVFMMGQSLSYEVRVVEQRMQAVLDNTPAVIYVKDLEGRYLLVNRQFGGVLQNGERAARGWTDYDIFPAEQADRLRANDERVIAERSPLEFEETIDVDGETRHFVSCKFPIFDPGGTLYALGGTSLDVTESRKLQKERDSLREQVLHANRVAHVSVLSASLAHELSQPLTAMISNAQAGLRFMDKGELDRDELRDILQDIVRDDERAIAIIDRLRAMLRQKAPVREPIALAPAVAEALDLLDDEIHRRGARCERRLNHAATVLADRVQIQQVVLNLVMNGLDALETRPPGQRDLCVSIGGDGDAQVRVAVRDSGSGLPADQMDRLFDSFYSTKRHGFGLGLTLCRSIIESHGGRVWASDNADQGATVEFILPTVAERRA